MGTGLSGRDGDGSVGSCNRGGCLEVVSLVFSIWTGCVEQKKPVEHTIGFHFQKTQDRQN